jgi:hypothetical protein
LDLAYLVIVPKDWGGVVEELDISGAFSLVSPPTTRLETPAGTRLFVVGLEEDLPLGVHPRLTRGKPWSLGPQSSGLTAEPSCGPDGWVHEGDELELPLTPARPGIELFELAFGDGSFERAEDAPFTHVLSLRTPLDPCMGGVGSSWSPSPSLGCRMWRTKPSTGTFSISMMTPCSSPRAAPSESFGAARRILRNEFCGWTNSVSLRPPRAPVGSSPA